VGWLVGWWGGWWGCCFRGDAAGNVGVVEELQEVSQFRLPIEGRVRVQITRFRSHPGRPSSPVVVVVVARSLLEGRAILGVAAVTRVRVGVGLGVQRFWWMLKGPGASCSCSSSNRWGQNPQQTHRLPALCMNHSWQTLPIAC